MKYDIDTLLDQTSPKTIKFFNRTTQFDFKKYFEAIIYGLNKKRGINLYDDKGILKIEAISFVSIVMFKVLDNLEELEKCLDISKMLNLVVIHDLQRFMNIIDSIISDTTYDYKFNIYTDLDIYSLFFNVGYIIRVIVNIILATGEIQDSVCDVG